jgi:hypothetical protein
MSSMTINTRRTAPHVHAVPAGVPARADRCRPQRTPLRLTRRGRVVACTLLLVVVLAALTVFGSRSAATNDTGVPVETRTVEVGAGDTLWGIATEVAEPGEVRDMVHQIQELNAMPGPALRVGQEIAVPVG